jgi:hypothetical protein
MNNDQFVFPDPGVPRIPIERLDLYSDKAARYMEEARPFVARVDWPALRWTPQYLKQRFGTSKVKLYKKTGERVAATVADYIDHIDRMRSGTSEYAPMNAPVISPYGPEANPDFAPLFEDVRLPSYIKRERVGAMFVWLKNMGWYDNKSHAEPNAASNLNLQILGKKHVWLFPPHDARLVAAVPQRETLMEPPYFTSEQTVYAPSDEHPEFKDVRCYETVLEPGDVIFIPTLWFHWFVHYDMYQMNANVWFATEQVVLSPLSAEWAFMKALGVVLGGLSVAPERYAALPLETQELLTAIARTLVTDPRVTDITRQLELFENAREIQPDKKYFTK